MDIGTAMADIEVTGIKELREIIMEDIRWMQPPPGVTFTITGSSVVVIDMVAGLTTGRSQMTLLGVLLVFLGLLVVYRDIVKALSPIIPMLIVIGWSGLVMSAFDIAYNAMTAVMGSLILGVGSEFASGATTVFGFSALIASPFPMMSSFGLVTVIDVLLAMVVTFVIFPPLIVLIDTHRGKKPGIFMKLQDLRKKHQAGLINN